MAIFGNTLSHRTNVIDFRPFVSSGDTDLASIHMFSTSETREIDLRTTGKSKQYKQSLRGKLVSISKCKSVPVVVDSSNDRLIVDRF